MSLNGPTPVMSQQDLGQYGKPDVAEENAEASKVEGSSKAAGWKLMPDLVRNRQRAEKDQWKEKKLGVTWSNLTVKGISADSVFNENVLSQFNIPRKIKDTHSNVQPKSILSDSHGCVLPGEMLLVLGRPGSGCTTLLKVLANRRLGFTSVEGDVRYGTMDYKEAKRYRGQIVMNTEEEIFFPSLTVGQTIDFATRMKVPFHLPSEHTTSDEFQRESRDFLLRSMAVEHTVDTKVGNEYLRGVSGGERKRVSIMETIATRGSVYCWDNSTRGLDASTALEYTRAVRAMTDVLGLASIMTLYQAGNGIYNLFDKVLVINEGKEIFYGPLKEARPFMEELGLICEDSANTADFLTGVTVPTERRIRDGFEKRFPKNADEILAEYSKTLLKATMAEEYAYPTLESAKENTATFKDAVLWDKHKSLPRGSVLSVSFKVQVKTCIQRQYQIIWGDKASFLIKQVAAFVQALIAGSLFYNAPNDSSGLFLKGGSLFFLILYNSLMSMSEVVDSFTGRPVLAKHRAFGLFHPAAFCIAQITADIPIVLFTVSQFTIVIYFMTGLKSSASAYFTLWVAVNVTTLAMIALFRSIGAGFRTFDGASKVSGFMVGALILYAGFMVPRAAMHPWLYWIYYINPMAYAFEILLSNEFHDQIIPCVGKNIIPNGPSYPNSTFQACTGVPGARLGASIVTGDQYLDALNYKYTHIWRNFGIICAFWAFFIALTIVFTSRWKVLSRSNGAHLIPRENASKNKHILKADEESQVTEDQRTVTEKPQSGGSSASEATASKKDLVQNTSVFTWKDLSYTVKVPGGERLLLENVQGWVKPGMLGALMGSSGAGKTTLLDVLAQRKTDGTIRGSIMVDGRELSVSFQRSAGYCEQLDVHEPYATVREALEFSALLRQSRDTLREEKLKYVDTIVNLLEMQDIEHTLIGTTGNGLTVEQRKRLTIGVELVSKPSILIFLDEPTSGLDGQAAFNTIRFLRKLAEAGQAVLVTIHQPSALLFAEFDTLLLLAYGGKTVYFGDIGENAAAVKEYFARYNAPCPVETNPAEHMIDVVSGSLATKDWNQIWLNSPEYQKTTEELDSIINTAASKEPGTKDDGYEFAMPLIDQIKLVTRRMNISLYRNTDYINNKLALHVGMALFNGFTFWKIGNTVADLQLRLFTIFNFIFVAPGVINQLQPLFIERRDIYEAREKKSKMYSWIAFVTGLIVSELPYLCICAVFYFICWYYTVGFPTDSNKAGATLFVMLLYEFAYTGIGQFIAAYAPNAVAASLVNPLLIGILISICGVLIPYGQITPFWRYTLYYINPFTYLMGSMLVFTTYDVEVECSMREFAVFDTPQGQTCQSYLADFMATADGARTNLVNPMATSACAVCEYRTGADYLSTINLGKYIFGWRDAGIVVIFVISSYSMVFLLMKLRTKATKKAE